MTFYMLCHAMPLHGVQVKDEFWDGLESFLDSVPLGEQWIMQGDFNARVGSRVYLDDQWDHR